MLNIEYSPQALDALQCLRVDLITNWGEDVATKIIRKITSDIRLFEKIT